MLKYFLIAFSVYVLTSLAALWVNHQNKSKGLKGIRNIDCINPIKWMSVLYGFFLKLLIPKHVFEQCVLRMYDSDCAPCIKEGICIGGLTCGKDCACGCDTLAKMYSPIESDSGENWGPIVFNKNKYLKLREHFPIKITIQHGN